MNTQSGIREVYNHDVSPELWLEFTDAFDEEKLVDFEGATWFVSSILVLAGEGDGLDAKAVLRGV